jgi:hypothetical protein
LTVSQSKFENIYCFILLINMTYRGSSFDIGTIVAKEA